MIIAVFVAGYLAIVFEQPLKLNKAAVALITGVGCWTAYVLAGDPQAVNDKLSHHLGAVSQILFFLLGAMTIVEQIDAHDGFALITARIRTLDRRKLLVTISTLAFFLSAVLDNLTTSIVMMTVVRKLASDADDRMAYGGAVIIAANAGGAWSPIGDVTSTMLWMGGQVTAGGLIRHLLVPSIASVVVPLVWIGARMKGDVVAPQAPSAAQGDERAPTTLVERWLVLVVGLGVLVLVPVFKAVTHLPPVMGILLGLGVLWTVTEIVHRRLEERRSALSIAAALQRIDAQSVLFFLGILLAISALESVGTLAALAAWMDRAIGNVSVTTMAIGLSSSVVDNVPLVAASQGMYSLAIFPTDHHFWRFLAYCAGTGGSILIIGSAAGIAVMGSERISFGWYVRKMSLPALLGYLAGAATYLAMSAG